MGKVKSAYMSQTMSDMGPVVEYHFTQQDYEKNYDPFTDSAEIEWQSGDEDWANYDPAEKEGDGDD